MANFNLENELMNRILFLSICFLSFFGSVNAQTDIELKNELFSDQSLQRFEIFISPDTLEWLYENVLSDYKFKADLVFKMNPNAAADTLKDVGFRLRGNTSRHSGKKSFTIDINEFVKGRRFYGVKGIDLNGEHNDPSIMRAEISWELLNQLNLPASRSSHAEVYINGDFYGVYQNVENLDDVFLDERFGNSTGNFYKCLYPADLRWLGENASDYQVESNGRRMYELKTNEDIDDYSDLRDFIHFLTQTDDQTFAKEIEDRLDVDGVLKWLTADILLGNWDNYWHNKNNFYLYNDPQTQKFHFIPYDYDNTMGIAWDNLNWENRNPYNWSPNTDQRPLVKRILAFPEYKNRLSYYLDYYQKELFTLEKLQASWIAKKQLIQTAVEADEFRTLDYNYSIEQFNQSYTDFTQDHVKKSLQNYVEDRISSLQTQLIIQNIPARIDLVEVKEIIWDPTKQTDFYYTKHFSISHKIEDDKALGNASYSFKAYQNGELISEKNADFGSQIGTISTFETILHFQQSGEVSFEFMVTDSDGLVSRYPKNPDRFVTFSPSIETELIINEVMASNESSITDEAEEHEDWIELYNNSDNPINLSEYSLSDKENEPLQSILPNIELAPRSFIVLLADEDLEQGEKHLDFKISKGGEFIGLYKIESETWVDQITTPELQDDQVYVRFSDASPTWEVSFTASPNQPNTLIASLEDESTLKPFSAMINSIYPNPFNPSTTIEYSVTTSSSISLVLYDMLGREVQILVPEMMQSTGTHRFQLNASHLSSGLYFVRLTSNSKYDVKKLVLIK